MGLNQNELGIISIDDLLKHTLKIPEYQRPYNWSEKSAQALFNDLYSSFKENRFKEYRIGTVILHYEKGAYNIVDGQQRITTILLLFYAANQEIKKKELIYNKLSYAAIERNYNLLNKKFKGLASNEEKEAFIYFIKKQCTMVQVVIADDDSTKAQQEAFQFFDSQNNRGKSLVPHDLLKSYHLREMKNEAEAAKIEIISQWEDSNQEELVSLFKDYLFPITQWYRNKSGLGYSDKNIDSFKGISISNIYNYATYHKAANLYIEQTNSSGACEMLSGEVINQFQLTQPIIAGRRFFLYVEHYKRMIAMVKSIVEASFKKMENDFEDSKTKAIIRCESTGDNYVYKLMICAVLCFVDKFGLQALSDEILKKFYVWAYSLRLGMYAVYPETVNKYALGQHERIKNDNLFSYINEMKYPQDFELFTLKKFEIHEKNSKYNKIKEFIEKTNEVEFNDIQK